MAKDPAFLFYPGDFNTGTQFFSDEMVGKYMRLLMAQHQHGHLTENQVIFICKSYDKDIMSKFVKDSNGLWYNERLEIEVNKRKNYVESRSKNKEGKTKTKNISKSYDPHMENENVIENKDFKYELKEAEKKLDSLEERLTYALDEIYIDGQRSQWKQIDYDFEISAFRLKVRGSPGYYKSYNTDSLRLALQSQLRGAKKKPNDRATNKRASDAIITGGTEFGSFG